MSDYKYPWPASALTPTEMKLLFTARESHPDRPPITKLISAAVRAVYQPKPITPKEDTDENTHPSQ